MRVRSNGPELASARRPARTAALLASAATLLAGTGCYRHVVEARGLGTAGMQTHQATEPTWLDRLLGPEPKPVREGSQMRVN